PSGPPESSSHGPRPHFRPPRRSVANAGETLGAQAANTSRVALRAARRLWAPRSISFESIVCGSTALKMSLKRYRVFYVTGICLRIDVRTAPFVHQYAETAPSRLF